MKLKKIRGGIIAFLNWEDQIPPERRVNSSISDPVYGHPALVLDNPYFPAPTSTVVYIMLMTSFGGKPIETRFKTKKARKYEYPNYLPIDCTPSHFPGYQPLQFINGVVTGRRGWLAIAKVFAVHPDMLTAWKAEQGLPHDAYKLTTASWDHVMEKFCRLHQHQFSVYDKSLGIPDVDRMSIRARTNPKNRSPISDETSEAPLMSPSRNIVGHASAIARNDRLSRTSKTIHEQPVPHNESHIQPADQSHTQEGQPLLHDGTRHYHTIHPPERIWNPLSQPVLVRRQQHRACPRACVLVLALVLLLSFIIILFSSLFVYEAKPPRTLGLTSRFMVNRKYMRAE